jgi:hypothetical protein
VLVRAGGAEGGVNDGAVGAELAEAAVPAAAGEVVGAVAVVELCPAPELGAVAVGVPAW